MINDIRNQYGKLAGYQKNKRQFHIVQVQDEHFIDVVRPTKKK